MNIIKELTAKLNAEGLDLTERIVNKIITNYIRTKQKALLQGDEVLEEGLLEIKPHFRFNNTFAKQVTPNLTFDCKMNASFKKDLIKVFCTDPQVRNKILKDRKSEIDSNPSIIKDMASKCGVKPVF